MRRDCTRGVVDRDRRALFSDITVGPAGAGAAVRGARCSRSFSSSSRERASLEATRREVPAPHARARRQASSPPSREDFDNHAG